MDCWSPPRHTGSSITGRLLRRSSSSSSSSSRPSARFLIFEMRLSLCSYTESSASLVARRKRTQSSPLRWNISMSRAESDEV
ncbi:hypothetical protein D9M71_154830 [compost metagenome]